VAIESVCLDFLRAEQSIPGSNIYEVYGKVDNYLHEAALANNAPSGAVYDPEQDGIPLSSLGVHEHWNNNTDKKYSRNLVAGNGIELIAYNPAVTTNKALARLTGYKLYPNPFAETISIETDNNQLLHLNIYASGGQLVFSTIMKTAYIWNGKDHNGSLLPKGMYLVCVSEVISGRTVMNEKANFLSR
jgi:hypothetical protein